MLTIQTKHYNRPVVKDVESHFRVLLKSGETFSDNIYTEIMKAIDHVNYRNNNIITTPFGDTTLESLSSGCKALLIIVHNSLNNIDNPVSIEECGENALELLFKISDKIDTIAYVCTTITVFKNNIQCKINDKLVKGGLNIYNILSKINEYN